MGTISPALVEQSHCWGKRSLANYKPVQIPLGEQPPGCAVPPGEVHGKDLHPLPPAHGCPPLLPAWLLL